MLLNGIITAMVTPFDDKGKIDVGRTKKLIDKLIRDGVHGLFILGTNGEFFRMDKEEKIQFAKLVIDYTNERVPVYVGAGGNDTKEVIQLSREMERIGADALSIITPYLIKLTQKELYVHYKHISESVKIPIILYNIPQNTGINIEPETVGKLAKKENIIGIKDSSGNLDNLERYIEQTNEEKFSVLVGSDSLILKALQLGATGAVAATSNVLPQTDIAIYKCFIDGRMDEAKEAQMMIENLRFAMKLGTVPSGLKRCLFHLGYDVGEARLPTLPVSEDSDLKIKNIIKDYQSQLEKL